MTHLHGHKQGHYINIPLLFCSVFILQADDVAWAQGGCRFRKTSAIWTHISFLRLHSWIINNADWLTSIELSKSQKSDIYNSTFQTCTLHLMSQQISNEGQEDFKVPRFVMISLISDELSVTNIFASLPPCSLRWLQSADICRTSWCCSK